MSGNPFDPGYYTSAQLRGFGFARVGEHVLVARNCTIIGLENITLGDNVRIDGPSSLIAPRGKIAIGSFVHVAMGCLLGGRGGIAIDDFSSLSQGVRLFTAIDDFSGQRLSNAVVPENLTGVRCAPIAIGRHVPIGTGSVVLPAVDIGEGAAIGIMSVIAQSIPAWSIYSGNPARKVGDRSRAVLSLEPRTRQEDLF
jgi:acetyltransferase-like isoleucine patch superfamily enzyme